MCHKLCHFIWDIWWFHRSKDFEAMKAGKLAIWPWMICLYNENTLVDLPSSVMAPAKSLFSDRNRMLTERWLFICPVSVCIYICKLEVEINEIRNFYKVGAEFQNTPPSIIGQFFLLNLTALWLDNFRKMK